MIPLWVRCSRTARQYGSSDNVVVRVLNTRQARIEADILNRRHRQLKFMVPDGLSWRRSTCPCRPSSPSTAATWSTSYRSGCRQSSRPTTSCQRPRIHVALFAELGIPWHDGVAGALRVTCSPPSSSASTHCAGWSRTNSESKGPSGLPSTSPRCSRSSPASADVRVHRELRLLRRGSGDFSTTRRPLHQRGRGVSLPDQPRSHRARAG